MYQNAFYSNSFFVCRHFWTFFDLEKRFGLHPIVKHIFPIWNMML